MGPFKGCVSLVIPVCVDWQVWAWNCPVRKIKTRCYCPSILDNKHKSSWFVKKYRHCSVIQNFTQEQLFVNDMDSMSMNAWTSNRWNDMAPGFRSLPIDESNRNKMFCPRTHQRAYFIIPKLLVVQSYFRAQKPYFNLSMTTVALLYNLKSDLKRKNAENV